MSIGGPFNAGTNTATVGATTLAVTLGANIPAGSLIVVGVNEQNVTSAGTGTVADTAVNTYSVGTSDVFNNPNNLTAFYAWNSLALSSGNTITFSTPGALSSTSAMSVTYWTGIRITSDPIDGGGSSTGTGANNSPNSGLGTPARAGELAVGFAAASGTGLTFVQDTNVAWASPPNAATTSTFGLWGGSFIQSGTGSLAYKPTFSAGTGTAWSAAILMFAPQRVLQDMNSQSAMVMALRRRGAVRRSRISGWRRSASGLLLRAA